ncbi:MAG: hypothetical protein ACE5FA_11520, partial [Dehalococcoidia bacterium]
GYHSSYNHGGGFLTINEVAEFNIDGLWRFKTARFCRYGSLKQTAEHFVEASEGGMTHEELACALGVRAHNTLLELAHEQRIHRERIGPTYVYFTRKVKARRAQISRRRSLLKESRKPRLASAEIIATLLELIRDPGATRDDIVLRCQRAGTSISRAVVDAIFETYDLDKKRAP